MPPAGQRQSRAVRTIARGALLTGARYSELARMHVADFHRDSGTVLVRTSKAGKVRHIELTTEGLEFFNEITAGRAGTEFLFHRDSVPWASRTRNGRSPMPAAPARLPRPHRRSLNGSARTIRPSSPPTSRPASVTIPVRADSGVPQGY